MKEFYEEIKSFVLSNRVFCFSIIATIVILYFLFNHVIMFGIVPSRSMEPFLVPSDIVICQKFGKINQGDVITFNQSDNKNNYEYIKRVIGIGGDHIVLDGYSIYRNEQLLNEPYVKKPVDSGYMNFVVPENTYFLLGDNRENSKDARFWDNPYISKEDITGKLIFIISEDNERK